MRGAPARSRAPRTALGGARSHRSGSLFHCCRSSAADVTNSPGAASRSERPGSVTASRTAHANAPNPGELPSTTAPSSISGQELWGTMGGQSEVMRPESFREQGWQAEEDGCGHFE